MVRGEHDHDSFRVDPVQMERSKSQSWSGVPGLGFEDEVPVPGLTEFSGELYVDGVRQSMVGYDKDILPVYERQNAFHRFLDKRILGADLEQLFRHLLPGKRPEPRTRTSGHDDCKHMMIVFIQRDPPSILVFIFHCYSAITATASS